MIDTLKAMHTLIDWRDHQAQQGTLADDVVFRSPVVQTPQRGRAITALSLMGVLHQVMAQMLQCLAPKPEVEPS